MKNITKEEKSDIKLQWIKRKIEKINDVSTDITPRTRYNMLMELISNDLLASTQVRNRIAHGQWKFAFNNDLRGLNNNPLIPLIVIVATINKTTNFFKLNVSKLSLYKL